MKVTHVISSLDKIYGGPSRSVPHLCESLAKNNIDTTLLSIESQTPNLPNLSSNVKTKLFHFMPPRKISYSIDLGRELQKIETDIFHGHGIWQLPTHQMAKIARERGKPYVITPRGMLEEWSLEQKSIQKNIFLKLFQLKDLKLANCLHATASNELMSIRKLGLENPVAIIPNGINTDIYKPSDRPKLNTKKRILFLSRIHKKKGINFLIEAWASIYKKFPDWEVQIVGVNEDSYLESMKQLIQKNDIVESIKIIEPVYGTAKIKLYQESDLFVLPSHSENFGIVVAEALSSGVPVITTKGTPWEELNSNECGWWINIGTEPLISSLTEALLMTDSARHKLGQNGRQLILDKYSIEHTGFMMKQVYDWMLNNNEKPDFVFNR
ncbi:MAG: hypothetical protein A2066_00620 [Bacteroidetes bacterium GWB2_41_8]|nr:MAG: hypothetical protein A2066_00620 [Bacteroidetes bacterium GWB2_41_8]